jgi:predicted nucleic acid-binding protein
MADVALDANVVVGLLDKEDSLNARARELVHRIRSVGDEPQTLDFVAAEAVSVLCRRATERKRNIPDLVGILAEVRRWYDDEELEFVQQEFEKLYPSILEVIVGSGGKLNFNDAALIVLQQKGFIDEVATFDTTLASQPGFRTFG